MSSDPWFEPRGFRIAGWWCPRGGGHTEADPEKSSAVPLLVPEEDYSEVRAWFVKQDEMDWDD